MTLNPNTQRAKNLVYRAMNFDGYKLSDCYGSFSRAKERVWDYCFERFFKEKGEYFHICSHNSFTFSVAWFTDKGVRVETRDNSYFIPMENAVDKYLHW